jgi:nucleolar protein 15
VSFRAFSLLLWLFVEVLFGMSEEEDDGFVQFDLQPGDLKEGSSSEENDNEKTATGPAPATVVYVGHLPFGFFENEMKSFFAQFGGVVNTKIARSTRSARSKGYGWVQFKSADVAAIACKTMNGYMVRNTLLRSAERFFFFSFFFFLFIKNFVSRCSRRS